MKIFTRIAPGIMKMRTKLGMNGRMIARRDLANANIGFSNVGFSYVGKSNAIK